MRLPAFLIHYSPIDFILVYMYFVKYLQHLSFQPQFEKRINGINKICIKASLILHPILCKKANLTTNGTGINAMYSNRLQ